MSSSASIEGTQRSTRSFSIPALFFLCPLVTTAVPRLTWLVFLAVALALIFASWRRTGRLVLPHWNAALIAVLVFAAYVLLSANWAVDARTALIKALLLAVVSLLAFCVSAALPQLDSRMLRKAALAFAVGGFVAIAFLTLELLTDGAITRLVLNSVHLLRQPNAKHATIIQNQIVHLNPSDLNQNVAILTLNLWPALLALQVEDPGWRARLPTIFLLAVGLPVFLSEHQSSQLALVFSIVVNVLAQRWPKPVVKTIAVLWCMAFVLAIPAAVLSYKLEVHEVGWLPSSFRARVIIWEYTAEQISNHPWLGIGADGTRALNHLHETKEPPAGFVFPRTTAWHAHDFFLQTLFELGVVGATLFAVAGALLAMRILLLPRETQPFAAAAFGSFLIIAAFAWGMWQTWLISAVALLTVYLLVVSDSLLRTRSVQRGVVETAANQLAAATAQSP